MNNGLDAVNRYSHQPNYFYFSSPKRPVTPKLTSAVVSVAAGALICVAMAKAAQTLASQCIANRAQVEKSCTFYHKLHEGIEIQTKPFEFENLPDELCQLVTSFLDSHTLGAFSQASTQSNRRVISILHQRMMEAVIFSKEQWLAFFGLEVLDEPALPFGISEILSRQCPADYTKKVRDTHMLVLIPKGETADSLWKLVENYFQAFINCRLISKDAPHLLVVPNEKSYWVLTRKDVIDRPGFVRATNKGARQQGKKISQSKDGNFNYTLPTALEIVASILALEARSASKMGNFPISHWRYQVEFAGFKVLVSFTSTGLVIRSSHTRCGPDDLICASGVLRWLPQSSILKS